MSMRFYPFFVLVFLIASFSGPTSEELIAENQTLEEQRFEQFYSCYEIAKTAPEITKDYINWEREDANIEHGEYHVY